MKVGIVLHNDIDVDVRVINQWNIFKKKSVDCYILCTGMSRAEDSERDVVRVATESAFYKFRFISASTLPLFKKFWRDQIIKRFQNSCVELLHVHDLYMAAPAVEAAKELNLPVVLDLHENYPEAFKKYSWTKKFPNKLFVNSDYWNKAELEALQSVNGIVALDENYRSGLQIKSKDHSHKIDAAVYPNVPDLSMFQEGKISHDKASDEFKIFYFGIVSYARFLHVASRAVKLLNEKGEKVRLVIAGNVIKSDQEYFKTEVLNEFVEHIPWIDLKDLGANVQCMDACISPIEKNAQHESGVANKVFQYMYFGKPVLVSNCIPQQRLIENENCGLVYEYRDNQALADHIKWLIDNPDGARQMGENGRNSILEKYNTGVLGNSLIDLYSKVLRRYSAKD